MMAILCPFLGAQTSSPAPSSPKRPNAKSAAIQNPAQKPSLSELTLVSTRAAGKAALKAETAKQKTKTRAPQVPVVAEFHTTGNVTSDHKTFAASKTKNGHRLLRGIHGSIYGANAAGERDAGGDIGATSKSGKLNIFVGSEGAAATTLRPH